MPNMAKIISGHNKKILKQSIPHQSTCSCRNPEACPVDQECLTTDVVYQAEVTRQDNQETETYIGLTSKSFKARWTTHKTSFRLLTHEKETTLSAHIWNLKKMGVNFDIKWKIVSKTNSYTPSSKMCWLCTKEKYFIIFKPEMATLNKRNEFFSKCPHKRKFKLCNQS